MYDCNYRFFNIFQKHIRSSVPAELFCTGSGKTPVVCSDLRQYHQFLEIQNFHHPDIVKKQTGLIAAGNIVWTISHQPWTFFLLPMLSICGPHALQAAAVLRWLGRWHTSFRQMHDWFS
jgi:hypothetical protein